MIVLEFSDAPAGRLGPTLEFDDYIDVTYGSLRYEGELVAFLNQSGLWEIASGDHEGETYTDVTIWETHDQHGNER